MTKTRTQHRAAMFAMFHWHLRYAHQSLDPMGFFRALTPGERAYAREAVREVCGARPESALERSRA